MKRFSQALDELRRERPEAGMDRAVVAFAPSQTLREGGRSGPIRMRIAVGALAATLAGALLWSTVTPAQASLREQVRAALRSVRAVHTVGNGVEFWSEGTKRRYRFGRAGSVDDMTRGFDGKRTWEIQYKSGFARIATEVPWGFGPEPVTSMEDLRKAIAEDGTRRPIQTRLTQWHGRTVVELSSERRENGGGLFREVHLADARTKLPFLTEYFQRKGGDWHSVGVTRYDYPDHIPNSVFRFDPPHGFEVYDEDALTARLRQGFAKGPTRTVAGVTVRLCGVLQDRSGNVSVIWTGGATPPSGASLRIGEASGAPFTASYLSIGGDPASPARAAASIPRQNPTPPAEPILSTVRPAGWYGGKPYFMAYASGPKRPGNAAVPLRITLPVCVPDAMQSHQGGPSTVVRAASRQVGTADWGNVVPLREVLTGDTLRRLDPGARSRFSYRAGPPR